MTLPRSKDVLQKRLRMLANAAKLCKSGLFQLYRENNFIKRKLVVEYVPGGNHSVQCSMQRGSSFSLLIFG